MRARPFKVDFEEYPFPSSWFEQDGSGMHYIDVGQGIPIVFCHGNPTWSYLYRNIIKQLADECRCIAYDLPGFGFSDHPPEYNYTPQEQTAWVESLIFDHLELDRFMLVMQDWGGPIGLSIATRYPDRIAGMVISSSWAWPPRRIGRLFSAIMGSRLGQYLILQRNAFATTMLAKSLGMTPSPTTLKAYADPFPTPASRKGCAVFPIQIVAATPWLAEIEKGLPALKDKPVEFIFGLKDLGTRPKDMALWLGHFPDAGVQKFPDANHFTQEDCPDAYVQALRRLMGKNCSVAS